MTLQPLIAGLLSIVFIAPAAPAEARSSWLESGTMPIESEFLKAHSEPSAGTQPVADESKQVPEAKAPSEPVVSSPSITEASIPEQIRQVWGVHAEKALRVFRCESGLNPAARSTSNRYWGIAQFGPWARAAYGWSNDSLTQIQNAYRLFLAEGWGQWSCA